MDTLGYTDQSSFNESFKVFDYKNKTCLFKNIRQYNSFSNVFSLSTHFGDSYTKYPIDSCYNLRIIGQCYNTFVLLKKKLKAHQRTYLLCLL